MSNVPNMEADETQDEMNSLKMHCTGWLRTFDHCHHPVGVMSTHITGMSNKVDSRFTTTKLPTNLKDEKQNSGNR